MEETGGTGHSQGINIMNSNARLSLADLNLPRRVSTLIALAERFGPVHPCYGIDRETKACTCGGVNRKTKKPCNAGKHPIIGAWQVNASTDPSTISQFANRYPEANWGVVTGDVIDVIALDEKPGISGLENLRVLEAKLGLDVMKAAIVVKTGNGLQLWFRHDPEGRMRTTAGIRPGIDIRAGHNGKGHGYVMAPGSRHANGSIYQIRSMGTGKLEPAPESLIAELFPIQGGTTQVSISYSNGGERGGPKPRFQPTNNRLYCEARVATSAGDLMAVVFRINTGAKLTPYEEESIRLLRQRRPVFDATWRRDRGPKCKYPFKHGRESNSEYEGSVSFFLRSQDWEPQAIMNALAVWNRLHGIQMRAYASRYAATISKACALAKPSLRENKGCWNPCDDPFAVSDGPAWQPDNLDDFAEEEAAELVRIRAGGMHGAAKDGRGGSIHTPCRPSQTD